MYLNTSTYNVYSATAANSWVYKCNIKGANATTTSEATTSAKGLMSAADKTKLNGIATGANNYSLPTASAQQKGGIKVGTGLSISSETMSVSYGTTSTTAAVGNDSRFGKVGVSEAEYRSEDPNPAISYYKLGLINSGQTDSGKLNDLSVTSANFVYNSE
jgi:hypothetical protein